MTAEKDDSRYGSGRTSPTVHAMSVCPIDDSWPSATNRWERSTLHDLPDLLSHCKGLLGCRKTPCELDESQSRLDLGDAYASPGNDLPHASLPLVVRGLDVADVVGCDRDALFAKASTTSRFLAVLFALRYSRTAWVLLTPLFFAMSVAPVKYNSYHHNVVILHIC